MVRWTGSDVILYSTTNTTCRDQELRFTVHDSSDYYQLKVSVFNDDKKTDLIGETWVSLLDVVIPGGGQSDIWHNLNCKGKYAGEIRIEITYYDTRPKQERPADKVRQSAPAVVQEGARESMSGPRQPRANVKRRPLPTDPTGATPPPAAAPPPNAISDYIHAPSRGYNRDSASAQNPSLEYVQASPRGSRQPGAPSSSGADHAQVQPRGYREPVSAPSVMADHVQTPPRGYREHANHIQPQSPLQAVEYNTPSAVQQHNRQQRPNASNSYDPSAIRTMMTPEVQPRPVDNGQYEIYDPSPAGNDYIPGNVLGRYEDPSQDEEIDPRLQYNYQQAPQYALPPPDEYSPPASPGGPPPPPPKHGVSQSSHSAPPISSNDSYGFPPTHSSPARSSTYEDARQLTHVSPARSDVYEDPRQVIHRPSLSAVTHERSYQAYSPTKPQEEYGASWRVAEQAPRHDSFDQQYNYASMQPSVEDDPSSPRPSSSHRDSGARVSPYGDRRYDESASPAPLSLTGRGSAASGRQSTSSTVSHQYPSNYTSNGSLVSMRDNSQAGTSITSRASYNQLNQSSQPYRRQSEDQTNEPQGNYVMPPVPSTLVPGMDPAIAQEVAERIYQEKRSNYGQNTSHSPRGSQQLPQQYQQSRPHPLSRQEVASQASYQSSQASPYYEDSNRRSSYAPRPNSSGRPISPNPQIPIRKSVSPAPMTPEQPRRLSGVPFGPDSFDALNPSIATTSGISFSSAPVATKRPEIPEKIITHDGREIDPSDYLPMDTYAAEPEPRGPKYASQLPDQRPPRASPSGAQPLPASGRRQLRVAGRPNSIATSSPIYMNNGGASSDPSTPTGTRNRLQKKSARQQPASPMPVQSSPLAPISPYQDNSPAFTPRNLPRSHTGDFGGGMENYAPGDMYGGSGGRGYVAPQGYRGSAPPLPAKEPLGGQAGSHASGGVPQSDAWTLLDEMRNIDLGSGRARRKGY